MNNTDQNYCLILAGGIGTRLWPMSTEEMPKQFLDVLDTGRTLLQQTYDRFLRFIKPDHIYVSTNQQYLKTVQEQLPDVPRDQIIAEPVRRGTLASVALGSLIIAAKRDAQANVVCSPADHWITDETTFQDDIRKGLEFVGQEKVLLTMGLRPSRPKTSYGYIQMGEEVKPGFSRVKSFTEKPAREYAEMFLQSGEFLWNVGIFMCNVQVMLQQLIKQVPAYEVELPRLMSELAQSAERKVPDFFTALPKLNVDYGVLDGNDKAYVQQAHFGWADIGTWSALLNDAPIDDNDNLVLGGKATLYNSGGNIIRLPKGQKAVICGLKDYVVIQENGILMVCPKEDAAMMRRMRTESLL